MLHLASFLRRSAEQQEAAGQSVEPMDRPQVLQVVLFGQDEYDRVVSIPAARVYLETRGGGYCRGCWQL